MIKHLTNTSNYMKSKPVRKNKNGEELDKFNRVKYCTVEGCNEKAFEFGKCLEHSKEMLDDSWYPSHNDYTKL